MFDLLAKIISKATSSSKTDSSGNFGLINYGAQKKDGSHDHRYNRGGDRTTLQKQADEAKKKT
ncbi:hypothetical protein HBH1_04394 [Herbaspirillum sp. BH-1]|uniref:hypothetical protein n=1 Tax=Herbaspirillum sp. (strain BH-1) TaxID=2058884 RepID=UPI000C88CFE2|nr:hypothetical protein [Herbaspirillum sp. BH-1]PLY57302.1 hypothetical protein HBH1_04394 [Herbaspirillum sp. BH-1]